MAARYWVGGSGNWSDADVHWAATSGGDPDGTVPTTGDQITFDANSAADDYVVTVDANTQFDSIAVSGPNTLSLVHEVGAAALLLGQVAPADGTLVTTIAPAATPLQSFVAGTTVAMTMLFVDEAGVPYMPATVTGKLTTPDGVTVDIEMQMLTPGYYRNLYLAAQDGLHMFRIVGSGDLLNDAAGEGAFMVTSGFQEGD